MKSFQTRMENRLAKLGTWLSAEEADVGGVVPVGEHLLHEEVAARPDESNRSSLLAVPKILPPVRLLSRIAVLTR